MGHGAAWGCRRSGAVCRSRHRCGQQEAGAAARLAARRRLEEETRRQAAEKGRCTQLTSVFCVHGHALYGVMRAHSPGSLRLATSLKVSQFGANARGILCSCMAAADNKEHTRRELVSWACF